MSEGCYHNTSVNNVYTAAWQEIVKLKVLELRVLLSEQLLAIVGTERSNRPQLMCFLPFKPHLQLTETLLSIIYAVECGHGKIFYHSWSEE